MSSASIISQSDLWYKPLPTLNSQPKDIVRETLLRVDANDFTPHANTPVVTGPPLTSKKEHTGISPAGMCKSEQYVTVKQDVMPTPQSPLQLSHTQLEEVLLETLEHLTQQSSFATSVRITRRLRSMASQRRCTQTRSNSPESRVNEVWR